MLVISFAIRTAPKSLPIEAKWQALLDFDSLCKLINSVRRSLLWYWYHSGRHQIFSLLLDLALIPLKEFVKAFFAFRQALLKKWLKSQYCLIEFRWPHYYSYYRCHSCLKHLSYFYLSRWYYFWLLSSYWSIRYFNSILLMSWHVEQVLVFPSLVYKPFFEVKVLYSNRSWYWVWKKGHWLRYCSSYLLK